MDFTEYQQAAMRTATSNERANTPEQRIVNAALGLIGESGEIADTIVTGDDLVDAILALAAHVGSLADNVKKSIYHGHAYDRDDALLVLDCIYQEMQGAELAVIGWNFSQKLGARRIVADEKTHLIKEAGDILWYVALAATALYTPLETVAQGNIDKLRLRYPDGFSSEASRNRDG